MQSIFKQSNHAETVPAELHAVVRSFGGNKTRCFYDTRLPKSKSDGTSYRIKVDDLPPENNVFRFSQKKPLSRDETKDEMDEMLAEADEEDDGATNAGAKKASRKNYMKKSYIKNSWYSLLKSKHQPRH